MARSSGEGGGDEGAPAPERLPQHPYVERLKPDPAQPAKRVVELVGLPGNSDRPGYQRLYLTTTLNYYAEFLTSDMVYSEAVSADHSPFHNQEATRVSVSRDATIHYIWARSPQPIDEFDLDVRLGAPAGGAAAAALPVTPPDGCQTPPVHTCQPCGPTAVTCPTHCNQNTCAATCPATCAAHATCAGHGTCGPTACVQTCNTQCAQATCANTQCNQLTCATCANVHTCAATCWQVER
jgi:hypothetical protein